MMPPQHHHQQQQQQQQMPQQMQQQMPQQGTQQMPQQGGMGGMGSGGMIPNGMGPGMAPPQPGFGGPPQPGFGGPPPPGVGGGMVPGGGSYAGAQFPSAQSGVEEFSSLALGGGGPGGDQGVDPASFPRPGDDIPNPNTELSCDPRYLRLTVGCLPVNNGVKQRFGLPVACIVRPLVPGENVPVAQFGSTGIVRCRRCRTYINPFVQFIDGGRRFRCNVCSLPNEVRRCRLNR
jgi:protein transport protein SEC24